MIETNITKMLGIKHPIIAAPMGPFYTTALTIAVSEAGGLGVLSHTNLGMKSSLKVMKENMLEVVEHTDKNFGFNIRTSRVQFDAPMLCKQIPKLIDRNPKLREQCCYIITSAGSPRMIQGSNAFKRLKENGSEIKHFHVAPALWLADKCVSANVDGLVVTGGEGGGHQSYEKISTLVLMQQVKKKHPDIPIIACGGYATGEGLAGALSMGAGAIAMGSRFIASKESEFHDNYKNAVPPSKAQDTLLVTGVLGPIRLWKNEYSLHHGLVASKEEKMAEEKALTLDDFIKINRYYELAYEGNTTDGAVLLGQSIGLIDSVDNVKEIIESIVNDAEICLKNVSSMIN
jgi:enoyl-[acyl-carrier protein] reductase II